VGGRWISRIYAVLLAAGSHGVISTNAELTNLFRRRLPWWAGKLREIPIGANIPGPGLERASARRQLRSRLGLASDAPVLGTFGFPASGKGFETLFEALQRANQSALVHLACIGQTREEDRGYRTGLDALAERLGMARRIHWLGEVPGPEAADLLSGSDAYVVPYDEGSSLRRGTLMAGFRVGVPVVTTYPRYPDAALRPGETIIAVPPRSPAALAEALLALLGDPPLQERVRQGARAVGSRFDWRAIAAEHVEFIQDLRQGRRLIA
jgi:glycosyltransferase involved in cell wall biosynthesis